MRDTPRLLSAAMVAVSLLVAGPALAQNTKKALQELDPDAIPSAKPMLPETEEEQAEDAPEPVKIRPAAILNDELGVAPVRKPGGRPEKSAKVKPSATPFAPPPAAAPPPQTRSAPVLKLPSANDSALTEAFGSWRAAANGSDMEGARKALARLQALKEEMGASNLDAISAALMRASRESRAASHHASAVELASAAVALAPDLPQARVELAAAYFHADPVQVGRCLTEILAGLRAVGGDPRSLRPVLADTGAAILAAWAATALTVVLVLLLRRGRYAVHDFHHLLPRAASPWHAAALGVTLLSLPIIFRLGVAPTLLLVMAVLSFYLTLSERLVASVLIAGLGAIPLLAGLLVQHTSFAGTGAEVVWQVERGGLGVRSLVDELERRAQEPRAEFAETYAAARYRLRRGDSARAAELFKLALAQRPQDARALTNLGNAMFALDDLEGALVMYQSATRAEPSLAAAHFNLAKLHERRAAVLPSERAAIEVDRAHGALGQAKQLDPSLASRVDPPVEDFQLSRLVISPPLPKAMLEALARVEDLGGGTQGQLSSFLLGDVPSKVAPYYPLALALLVVLMGAGGFALGVSRECEKCGRPVCRRCDPELGAGGRLCNQCVNVFVRKAVVPAHFRVRKQIEISRYQDRQDRFSYALGLLCSGGGHLFSGFAIRGALYAFLFLFVVVAFFLRHGVVRGPYGELPVWLRLVPLAPLFLSVYLLSLRGLYKRQSG